MNILDLGRFKSIVIANAVFLLFVTVVLTLNFNLAGRLASTGVAVKYAAQQRVQPRVVHDTAQLLESKLASRADINTVLEDLRRNASAYDEALAGMSNTGSVVDESGKVLSVGALRSAQAQAQLQDMAKIWQSYKSKLEPVLRFSGSPYAAATVEGESAAAATMPVPELSPRGKRLQAAVAELNALGADVQPKLAKIGADLTATLEASNQALAKSLRIVQVVGVVVSLAMLLSIFFYFARNLRKEELIANRARKETEDILRTVNEGLFLLDRDLKIGTERSMALSTIFRRDDFTGLTFDQLLRDIVPEKTLKTAMDYVALLWGERVNEKLVKTINPLSEVEVHFDNPHGGFDTHFLEFDFTRVKSEGALSHLLVTVNDVTKRVMLSRELQESQEKAQAQLDLLLRILHVEPDQLTSFLSDADVSLKMVNSILKEPAREETAFRAKIDGIYRQVHAVKGEAAALGLKTVEQRAHAFEESLNELKSRASLSGSDFLPLVVKLDDLFAHLAQVREMLGRLMDLHQAIASRRSKSKEVDAAKVDAWLAGKDDSAAVEIEQVEAPTNASSLDQMLDSLANRIASSYSKRVQVRCTGLDQVPEAYKRAVKDISIQLVRNAVVHGIEAPSERVSAQKPEVGTLSVEFAKRNDGFELIVQDDGRGLQLDRIKQVAVERGVITEAEAALLDPRQTMALIFRPGFSTAQTVTTDAGRGAGMDLVRILVAELGGRVGLASAGGRFSKFKIWLPATDRAVAA
jgi:HPt (histidine-containing phosphotransfer) domain-containing protein/two-component sensor histidine kinase